MKSLSIILASSSILTLAISAPAFAAQPAPATGQADAAEQNAESDNDGAIIVTARRKDESLLDVPQSIVAVTSKKIEDLNLLTFRDVLKIVSGIQINAGNDVNMRGVTYQRNAAAFQTTVAFYVNDVSISSTITSQGIFDIGQFEFLKGPQGTLRGASAPSGSITYTTRRASLDKVEANIAATAGTLDSYNLQGAVGVPIIQDVLSIRVAGLLDVNDINGVRSANSNVKPKLTTKAGRVSLRFEPSSNISANVMYQHMDNRTRSLGTSIFGTGSLGCNTANFTLALGGAGCAAQNPNITPNYNGPAIGRLDNMSVQELPSNTFEKIDLLTAQLDVSILGQKLSYVGGYNRYERGGDSVSDPGNMLPGYDPTQSVPSVQTVKSHEIRLASDERVAGIFDYVAGVFFQRVELADLFSGTNIAFLPGAFGSPAVSPGTYNPRVVNTRYELRTFVQVPSVNKETSFFANVTAHLTDALEISGGVRHLDLTGFRNVAFVNGPAPGRTGPIYNAAAIPAANCAGAGGLFGATYANVCDIPISGAPTLLPSGTIADKAWVWDAAVSFHATPNLMIYAHAGSAFRQGPFSPGINNFENNPRLNALTYHVPEKSTSYEVGLKWGFLQGRGRLSVNYFHQDFKNLFYTSPVNVPYLSVVSAVAAPTVANFGFTTSVPAKVDGIELDFAFAPTDQFNISGNFSWSKGVVSQTPTPCRDSNFDGTPDTGNPTVAAFRAAGQNVALCPFSGSSSTGPRWNGNLQAEYNMPVTDRIEGYIRGLATYQPSNPNSDPFYVVPAYGTLDLFLGIRDEASGWDLMVFGRNITKTNTVLTVGANQIQAPGTVGAFFGATGYTTITYVPRREFGITARFNFGGSR